MADTALRCRVCETVTPSRLAEQCDRCDGPLDVAYDWEFLRETVSRDEISAGPPSLWRYAPLLPVRPDGRGLPAGWTPLIRADRLSSLLGIDLWLKLETANPTQSFKDRIAAVAGAATAHLGLQTICCSSSGHLGDAIAAEAAARGLEAVILAPADAPLVSSEVYGAHLVGVDCSFDACHDLERRLSELFPWAFLEGNLEAYAAEGAKTVAYEIIEQFGWRAPNAVVCPIGSGRLFAKAAQGMAELDRLGWLEGDVPRLYGAQAEGCSPVAAAFADDRPISAVESTTFVSSLAVGRPSAGDLSIGAARASGGGILSVPEERIPNHRHQLAEITGIYADDAGGVAVGALFEAVRDGEIASGERVVLVVTGTGFATTGVGPGTPLIAPTVEAILNRLGLDQ
jgi:threonine synthase